MKIFLFSILQQLLMCSERSMQGITSHCSAELTLQKIFQEEKRKVGLSTGSRCSKPSSS